MQAEDWLRVAMGGRRSSARWACARYGEPRRSPGLNAPALGRERATAPDRSVPCAEPGLYLLDLGALRLDDVPAELDELVVVGALDTALAFADRLLVVAAHHLHVGDL